MQLANYLFFTTQCEEALAFYAECGLGRITELGCGERRGKGEARIGAALCDERSHGRVAWSACRPATRVGHRIQHGSPQWGEKIAA
jgi:uncharacterized glyoxalase superfamily protein PhnB